LERREPSRGALALFRLRHHGELAGGRDDIDGIETLADGRSVVKVRVRSPAEGGEANRAVTELLAKALGVPKKSVRLTSGATSRLKQVAVDGDPKRLGETLGALTAAKPN
jgi:uncharacterized protein (TIGR00251 family)